MASSSNKNKFLLTAAAAVMGVTSFGAQAQDSEFTFGGFVKLDMMVSIMPTVRHRTVVHCSPTVHSQPDAGRWRRR